MKLQVSQLKVNHHKDMVTALSWNSQNELFSCGDDQLMYKWSMSGEVTGKVCDLESFVTAMDWFPTVGKNASDAFAVACSDGTFRLMSKSGREDKKVDAHHGAVISCKWNLDGSALVTAGEDGLVKVWSKTGNLRSSIAQMSNPVYAIAWGSDNDQLLFSSGRELLIKSLQVGRKQLQWKAHEGVVMQVDWNPVNNLIVSGGEDRQYKVWDSFGRPLFQSQRLEHVVTSVKWVPSGEMFAVGSFNMLRLCDKTGWSHSRETPDCGSIMNISWTTDGTQLAGAGGNGAVVFAQVVERTLEWGDVEVTPPTLPSSFCFYPSLLL
jgi:intraflagellar transport protein 80